jgi:hypothetical protein
MEITMDLLPVLEMISLEGRRVEGASPQDASMIERKLWASGKPWCAVSAWVPIDVVSADGEVVIPTPMLPMVMYAHHVHIDSTHRFSSGASVMCEFATSYNEDGIVETAGVIYILMGSGFRKQADASTVKAARLSATGRPTESDC